MEMPLQDEKQNENKIQEKKKVICKEENNDGVYNSNLLRENFSMLKSLMRILPSLFAFFLQKITVCVRTFSSSSQRWLSQMPTASLKSELVLFIGLLSK